MSERCVRFQDKVCIVTGGASGIGFACAERFVAEGGKVAIVDYNPDHGKDAAQRLGTSCIFVQCDIGKPDEVEAAVNQVLAKWNRVDVIVNDAAVMTFDRIVDLKVEDWDRVLDVNLRAVYLFSKFAIPHMKNGAIVNISSVHAHETTANVAPYAASKGAMEALCRAVSQEYPAEQVRMNCVAPGAVDTPMLWNNPNVKSGREHVEGAIGKPEDIAAAVCFLASDEAKFINGTTLVADGARLDKL